MVPLKLRLMQLDNGAYTGLVVHLPDLTDSCLLCSHFNPDLRPELFYKCYRAGTCPAATIHPDLLKAWRDKIGINLK